MVYARKAKGRELTLASAGKLYRDALVMYDLETRSLWTQIDGAGLRGDMKGVKLVPLPSVETTWGQWKRLHPDTLVLKKSAGISGSTYAKYHASPEQLGIAGTQNRDTRLPGKALVVGLGDGKHALAVSLEALRRSPVYQTEVNRQPVVVVFHAATGSVQVLDRRSGKRVLNFELARNGDDVLLRDRETQTLWSGLSGKALEGQRAGQQLAPVRHMVSYWFAWAAYHRSTRLEPQPANSPQIASPPASP